MERKLAILINLMVLILSCGIDLFSQNLVPNYNFEEYKKKSTAESMLNLLYNWYNPNSATPDFWVKEFSPYVHTKDTALLNNQKINGYIGIGVRPRSVKPSYTYPEYYEYVGIKLSNKLEINKEYIISCDVYFGNQSLFVFDHIGAALTKDSIYVPNTKKLVLPHLSMDNGGEQLEKTGWVTVCDEYIAKGGEQFLILGNFGDDKDFLVNKNLTGTYKVNFDFYINWIKRTYYYIDNVVVEEANEFNLCDKKEFVYNELKIGKSYRLNKIY